MTALNPMNRRDWLATSAAGLAGLCGAAHAQTRADAASGWPQKPIRIVVGFPAGTSPDLLARALAEPLAQALGQSVVVENRVGAAGAIGAEVLSKATDQHTLGVVGNAAVTSVPMIYRKLPYSPKDLRGITVIGTSPMLIVAANSVTFNSPADFFAEARKAGTRWSYGSLGIGSSAHLGGELLKSRAGFEAVHVPYNGAPAVINAMIGGDIQLATLPIGTALTQVQAGRIKAVALTSASRSILASNVPALPEAGINALNIEIWNALMAPASLPQPIFDKISAVAMQLLRAPELRQKLFQMGWKADGTTPEAMDNRIHEDTLLFRDIITSRKITVEG